jgi:hypothetical protein
MVRLHQRVLPLTVLLLSMIAGRSVEAQVISDSITAWTELLRNGGLPQKAAAAARLAAVEPTILPSATRDVVLDVFVQLNTAMRTGVGVPGADQLGEEGLGEYYLTLAMMTYTFDTPQARRALALSAGGSAGVLRRAAKQGDDVIPLLVDRIRDGYAVGAALQTLALAWFWADSVSGPLSARSRALIVGSLATAAQSQSYESRRGVATALMLSGDPVFLPLASWLEGRASASGDALIASALHYDVIPTLEKEGNNLRIEELARRILRVLTASCFGADNGPRRGACESLQNIVTEAIAHLWAGRTQAARNAFESVIRRSDQALGSNVLSAVEYVLVADGARMILLRLF